jgi:hypothetical protein
MAGTFPSACLSSAQYGPARFFGWIPGPQDDAGIKDIFGADWNVGVLLGVFVDHVREDHERVGEDLLTKIGHRKG